VEKLEETDKVDQNKVQSMTQQGKRKKILDHLITVRGLTNMEDLLLIKTKAILSIKTLLIKVTVSNKQATVQLNQFKFSTVKTKVQRISLTKIKTQEVKKKEIEVKRGQIVKMVQEKIEIKDLI